MNTNQRFDEEKKLLIEQITKRNETIERLINENARVGLLNSEQRNKLSDIQAKNEKFKHKLKSNEFEIAIVGLEKAGKSTFANALIKNNILPSAPERCTFTSTRLVNGEDKAKVLFYTEEEFENIFLALLQEIEYPINVNNKKQGSSEEEIELKKNMLKKEQKNHEESKNSGLADEIKLSDISSKITKLKDEIERAENSISIHNSNQTASFKNLSLNEFEIYFNNLEEKNPALYKNHVGKTDEEIRDIIKCRNSLTLTGETKVFKGEQLRTDEFQTYIKGDNRGKDTSKPRSVKSIEIESSELKELANAIIYDVPGFDSPTKLHIRQTEERLKAADAIILVTNVGTNPSLQGTTLSVITKNTDEDGIALKEKLFVFGNQLDRVNNEADLTGNTDILIGDVEKYKIGERKRVFTGSAYQYLLNENLIDKSCSDLIHTIPAKISEIRQSLIEYYQTERFELLKKKIANNYYALELVLSDVLGTEFNENFSQDSEQAKITKSAYSKIEKNLIWELKKLIDDLKNEIMQEKYFTLKFKDSIHNHHYFEEVSEADFERSRILNNDSIRADLQINKINQTMRSALHIKYLEQFTCLIKSMTDHKAKEIEIRLLQIFTQAISGTNLTVITEIEPLCKKYILKVTQDVAHSENSFTYLLERFSRDLFDILLYSPILSQDRTNRYEASKKEYNYLDSYYSDGKGKLINLVLNQQNEMLFNLDEMNNIPSLVKNAINRATYISGANTIVDSLNELLVILQNTTSTFSIKDDSSVFEKVLELAKPSKTQEEVLHEINTDIANLRDILEKAVIPASNLELAFLNSIDKQIKRLIAAFEDKESEFSELWDDFSSKIVPIVERGEIERINERIEAHKLKKELRDQIKNILDK